MSKTIDRLDTATPGREQRDWKGLAVAGSMATLISVAIAVASAVVSPANGFRDAVRDTKAELITLRENTQKVLAERKEVLTDHEARLRLQETRSAEMLALIKEDRKDSEWMKAFLQRQFPR